MSKSHMDSIDKILTGYFSSCNKESFEYKGKTYPPMPLFNISPLLYRSIDCCSHCGACCKAWTMDFLPSEVTEDKIKKFDLQKRMVKFNGKEYLIYTDFQKDHEGHHCRHMSKENGYCMLHNDHPLSCDFELLRFVTSTGKKVNFLTKFYGRGWNMLLYDEKHRGALCKINPNYDINEIRRKLLRLKDWFDYFELDNNYINDLLKKDLPFIGTLKLNGEKQYGPKQLF